MQLISRKGQQSIDRVWQETTGLPLLLLMEMAAAAVCERCCQLVPAGQRTDTPVLVLAGGGQNGGDAFACARLLSAQGFPVVCRELDPQRSLPPEADANRQAWLNLGHTTGPVSIDEIDRLTSGLIIDGLFGTGLRADRPLPEIVLSISAACARSRQQGTRVVAIDLPSGLDCDSGQWADGGMQADQTITFVRKKIGMATAAGRQACGEITINRIGVSDQMVELALAQTGEPPVWQTDRDLLKPWCPPRPADSHKGLFGKVLIWAGSRDMPGAAVLAARAAARSGAGLVRLVCEAELQPVLANACPDALIAIWPERQDERLRRWQQDLSWSDAVVIGPGLGERSTTLPFLTAAATAAPRLLLDADALNTLARSTDQTVWQRLQSRMARGLPPALLTPHPGEFRRLAPDLDLTDRLTAARTLAERSGCLVLLKGAATVIAHPDGRVWLNATGHDGLARGGSGDILSGLAGGLMAQALSMEQAAVAAAWLHGTAAQIIGAATSRRSMLPSDLPDAFAQAFEQAGWSVGPSGRDEDRGYST